MIIPGVTPWYHCIRHNDFTIGGGLYAQNHYDGDFLSWRQSILKVPWAEFFWEVLANVFCTRPCCLVIFFFVGSSSKDVNGSACPAYALDNQLKRHLMIAKFPRLLQPFPHSKKV